MPGTRRPLLLALVGSARSARAKAVLKKGASRGMKTDRETAAVALARFLTLCRGQRQAAAAFDGANGNYPCIISRAAGRTRSETGRVRRRYTGGGWAAREPDDDTLLPVEIPGLLSPRRFEQGDLAVDIGSRTGEALGFRTCRNQSRSDSGEGNRGFAPHGLGNHPP